MQRHVLGVALPSLALDGRAVNAGDRGIGQVVVGLQRAEPVQADVPAQLALGDGFAGALAPEGRVAPQPPAGLAPRPGQRAVNELPLQIVQLGPGIRVDPPAGGPQEVRQAGLPSAVDLRQRRGHHAEERADLVSQGRAGDREVRRRPRLQPRAKHVERRLSLIRQLGLLHVAQVQAETDDLAVGRIDGVVVNGQHLLGGKRPLRLQALAQSPGADGVAAGPGHLAETDGVERFDGAVVGCSQVAALGVHHVRQQLVRHEALPVMPAFRAVMSGPAGVERVAGADGHRPHRPVADVPGRIAEDAVGGGETPLRQRLGKFARVPCPDHGEERLGRLAIGLADGHSLQRHVPLAAGGESERRDHRPEVCHPHGVLDRTPAADFDGLSQDGHFPPLAVEEVLVGMLGVGLETEQVRLIGAQRGQPPGDAIGKADENDRAARHGDAAGVEGLAPGVVLVEERRVADGRLRVADQHGRAGGGASAADDPGVAELRPARPAGVGLDLDAVVLGEFRHLADPVIGHVLSADHGRQIVRAQPLHSRRQWRHAEAPTASRRRSAGHLPPCDQVTRPVGGEELPQVPPADDAVGRRPRLGRDAAGGEQRVELAGVGGEIGIHAVAVRFQQRSRLRVEVGGDDLRSAVEAERPHLLVEVHRRLAATGVGGVADDFRQAALHGAERVVHLEAPVLGHGIADAVHGPGVGVGEDVRDAPGVADDLDTAGLGARSRRTAACRRQEHHRKAALVSVHERSP